MSECVFCNIIAGNLPGDFVYETDSVVVFISLEGHPMIVTKNHVENIHEVDVELMATIGVESKKLADAVKQGLECNGVKIMQNNGSSADQDVFHYHLHVFPKWDDGRLPGIDDVSKKLTAELIKSALPKE